MTVIVLTVLSVMNNCSGVLIVNSTLVMTVVRTSAPLMLFLSRIRTRTDFAIGSSGMSRRD